MIIAIDFDGTCVTHNFPSVGVEIGAAPVLKRLVEKGHKLILFTMRSNVNDVDASDNPEIHNEPGNYLSQAVDWFKKHDIPLYGVQVNPTQSSWTTSPKCYAELYIDDAALGCPLIFPEKYDLQDLPRLSDRPFVDWARVEKLLKDRKIL